MIDLATRAVERGWLSAAEAEAWFGPSALAPVRSRGLWVPVDDAPLYLLQGWRLVDDAGSDVLLAPPAHFAGV